MGSTYVGGGKGEGEGAARSRWKGPALQVKLTGARHGRLAIDGATCVHYSAVTGPRRP